MKILGNIIKFLGAQFNSIPPNYGVLHLSMAGLVIIVTVLLSIKFKNCKESTFRRIFLITWIIILVLEMYKQFIFTFSYDGEKITANYPLHIFPFQFCSMPLYVFPIIAFVKNEKVFKASIYFTMTYVLLAGLAVYVYPGNTLVYTIGVNFQTTIHHGSQIVLGVFSAVWLRKELKFKRFLTGIPIFLTTVLIAQILNFTIIDPAGIFNMFFISPYGKCPLPILESLYPPALPFYVFTAMYVCGFTLVSLIVFSLFKLIFKLFDK